MKRWIWLFVWSLGCGSSAHSAGPDPFRVVLAQETDANRESIELRQVKNRLRETGPTLRGLETLGWLYLERAGGSEDPGSFRLASLCGDLIADRIGDENAADLLRGRALHGLHRFREARIVAERVARRRGSPDDFGLLGDVALDLGELDVAADAYQRMLDLRPDARAYLRVATLRSRSGDRPGAIAALDTAIRGIPERRPAQLAWAWSERARLSLEEGDLTSTRLAAERAERIDPTSRPALRARARADLANGAFQRVRDRLLPVRDSASPTALRMLLEAQTELGFAGEAEETRALLVTHGERYDARSLAIFLASAGIDRARAISLAKTELRARRDAHSLDAMGWALGGNSHAALAYAQEAMASGATDPAIALRAGVTALRMSSHDDAERWLSVAERGSFALLPSEQRLLRDALRTLNRRS